MDYLFTKIFLVVFFVLITASYSHAASGKSSLSDLKKSESSEVKTTPKRKYFIQKGGITRVDTESLAEHLRELYPYKEGSDILTISKSDQPKKSLKNSSGKSKYLVPVIDTESLAKHLKELFPVKDDNSLVTANSPYAAPVIELLFGEEKGKALLREIDTDKMGKYFKTLDFLKIHK